MNVKFYENLHVHLHKVLRASAEAFVCPLPFDHVPDTYFVFTLPHRCLEANFQRMSMNMPIPQSVMFASSNQPDKWRVALILAREGSNIALETARAHADSQ